MKFLFLLNLFFFYLPSLLFALPNPSKDFILSPKFSEIDLQRKLSDYKSFTFITSEEYLIPIGKSSEIILEGSTPISKTEEKILSCQLESQNKSNCGALFPTGTELVASNPKKFKNETTLMLAVKPKSVKYVSPFGSCQSDVVPNLKLKCSEKITKRTDLKRFLPEKIKAKDTAKKEKNNLDSNNSEIIVDDFHLPEMKKVNVEAELTKNMMTSEEKEFNEFEGILRDFVLSDLINGVSGFTVSDIKI